MINLTVGKFDIFVMICIGSCVGWCVIELVLWLTSFVTINV